MKHATWLFVGICASLGVACSSFGDGPGTSGDIDGGGADAGEGGIVTGTRPDEALAITVPATRSFIVQGQSQTVTLTLTRGSLVQGPVAFAFDGLPQGVTTTSTALTNGLTQLDVKFTADAAAAQKLATVTVTATTNADDGTAVKAVATFELYLRGPSGSTDTTFGTNGHLVVQTGADDDDNALLVLGPHDEIYAQSVAGVACANGVPNCIKRYLPDGAPDLSYGINGEAPARPAAAGVVMPDNRFVGVGAGASHPTLVYRLSDKGVPDASFGDSTEGQGTIGLDGIIGGATVSGGTAVGLGADGSLAVSYFLDGGDQGAGTQYQGIARLGANGRLDTTFNGTGFARWIPADYGTQPPAIRVTSAGLVELATLCGREGSYTFVTTQLAANGQTDMSFGFSGSVSGSYPFTFDDIPQYTGQAIFADGSLVFPAVTYIVKVRTGGQYDSSFGTGGSVYLPTRSYAVAGTPDSKVVVFTKPDATGSAITRFRADGAPDETFAPNGTITADNLTIALRGRIAVQSDNRILAMAANDIVRFWN